MNELVRRIAIHNVLLSRDVADQFRRMDDEIRRLRGVLEGLRHIHDDNPSEAMGNTPPLDYARHMLGEVRQACREALSKNL